MIYHLFWDTFCAHYRHFVHIMHSSILQNNFFAQHGSIYTKYSTLYILKILLYEEIFSAQYIRFVQRRILQITPCEQYGSICAQNFQHHLLWSNVICSLLWDMFCAHYRFVLHNTLCAQYGSMCTKYSTLSILKILLFEEAFSAQYIRFVHSKNLQNTLYAQYGLMFRTFPLLKKYDLLFVMRHVLCKL